MVDANIITVRSLRLIMFGTNHLEFVLGLCCSDETKLDLTEMVADVLIVTDICGCALSVINLSCLCYVNHS